MTALFWMCRTAVVAGYRSVMCSTALTSSPTSRRSATRTAFFTGNRYAPVLLWGKSDVRHDAAPTVTATRTDPKPRRVPAVRSVMSALISAGSDTKCQPSAPGYRHSGAVNSKLPMHVTGRHYGVPPTGLGPAQPRRSPRPAPQRHDRTFIPRSAPHRHAVEPMVHWAVTGPPATRGLLDNRAPTRR